MENIQGKNHKLRSYSVQITRKPINRFALLIEIAFE